MAERWQFDIDQFVLTKKVDYSFRGIIPPKSGHLKIVF